MKVIVVADGDPPVLASLGRAAADMEIAITAVAPADADSAIDDAIRGGGSCVVVGVESAASAALDAAASHGAVRGFISLDGDLGAHDVELVAEWPEVPVLATAQSSFVCRRHHCHDFGTHSIFIGELIAAKHRADAAPLTYYDRHYIDISEAPESSAS